MPVNISKIFLFTVYISIGKLRNVVAKWPGSCHDSFIFRSSALGRQLEENSHNTDDGILLGDSGYALRPYLITPYLQPVLPHQRRLNRAQKKHDV